MADGEAAVSVKRGAAAVIGALNPRKELTPRLAIFLVFIYLLLLFIDVLISFLHIATPIRRPLLLNMDPEKTLTFCLGLKVELMTMTLKYVDGTTEASTVAFTQKELDQLTVHKVVKQHEGSGSQPVVSPKYCPGVNNNPGYLCETGHCCGETGCCTYYYELWWFWLLWTVLILFSCFCAYRHRRAKLRIQQQQRQREINLIAYNGACNFPSSMLDLSFLANFKLPSYDEVAARPTTPPPPYSAVFALQGGAMLGPSSSYPHHHLHSHPCSPYLGPGPSGLTSSQSSDNYTSCSCESCSLTSPCSTSFSVQVTDETYDSSRLSTPSEAGGDGALLPRAAGGRLSTPSSSPPSSQVPPDVIPALTPDVIPSHSCNGNEGISRQAAPLSLPLWPFNSYRPSQHPRLPLSPISLLSSLPSDQVHHLVYSDPLYATPKGREGDAHHQGAVPATSMSTVMHPEDEDEEDDEEDHFRHRRLTGDSGIEVCRCKVKREDREEEAGLKERERQERGNCSVLSPLLDDCVQHHGDAVIVVESSVV
ncbi:uncharacterized protein LOC133404032 isoform X1 [Phycodurus eques]|uniref:uncharacterized protein LOC133404032 isoform X1 n=2 Tax=Phycodurus eques TaxID=693459 RepID=UPI002ACD898A|nr:uncharacterized protein LOC133404032 isoform X1 [Phycodurus eques]